MSGKPFSKQMRRIVRNGKMMIPDFPDVLSRVSVELPGLPQNPFDAIVSRLDIQDNVCLRLQWKRGLITFNRVMDGMREVYLTLDDQHLVVSYSTKKGILHCRYFATSQESADLISLTYLMLQ